MYSTHGARGTKEKHCTRENPVRTRGDGTDNPNKNLGILKGCQDGDLFKTGTWNADFDECAPRPEGDLVFRTLV